MIYSDSRESDRKGCKHSIRVAVRRGQDRVGSFPSFSLSMMHCNGNGRQSGVSGAVRRRLETQGWEHGSERLLSVTNAAEGAVGEDTAAGLQARPAEGDGASPHFTPPLAAGVA